MFRIESKAKLGKSLLSVTLLVPLVAAGCAPAAPSVESDGSIDDVVAHPSAAALVSASDLQPLAEEIAFDADYVAYQRKAIEIFGTCLPYSAAISRSELEHVDELPAEELQARTGVSDEDLAELASLAAEVRAKFPWITSHSMDLHRLATVTNPELFRAFEAAMRTSPELAGVLVSTHSTEDRRRAALAFELARTSGEPSGGSDADAGAGAQDAGPRWTEEDAREQAIVGAVIAAVAIIVAVAVLTGHPEVLIVLVVAAVVFIVAVILIDHVRDIIVWTIDVVKGVIQWVNDLPELLDESFGHDDDECSNDSECDPDEYCDNGDLLGGIFGTNECEPDHAVGESCWADSECQTGCCKVHWFHLQCRPADRCD